MEYRTLGRTGMRVSPLCLGTAQFGRWATQDSGACARIVHTALDVGVNFIDTADIYSAGEAETIVGKALVRGRRDNVILTTKFNRPMGPDANERGNSRRWIMQAVERSLARLQTDWIDLYLTHGPELDPDIDETLGAFTDLVRQGKVRYIGSSVFPASQIVEAQWTARERSRSALCASSLRTRCWHEASRRTCSRRAAGTGSARCVGAHWPGVG